MRSEMDRRYVCTCCGVKWFIPAAQPERPDLRTCEACGGRLERLQTVAGQPAAGHPLVRLDIPA